MTKSKLVVALEAKVLALEAQLALGRTMYLALRNSHPMHAAGKRSTATTSYWRDSTGALWAKTKTGNTATNRRVPEDEQGNVVVPGLGAVKVGATAPDMALAS